MTVEDLSAPSEHEIDVSFYSKKSGKSQKLINNAVHSSPVEGKHTWYDYSFDAPVYLSRIKLTCSGYENWNSFDIQVFHVDGTIHDEKVRVENGHVDLALGKLANGFKFRPERKLFAKTVLLNVVAEGYDLEEFHQFEWSIKEFHQHKAELISREQKCTELEASVQSLEETKKQLDTEIGRARGQVEQLTTEVSKLKAQSTAEQTELADLEANLKSTRETKRSVESEISTKTQELNVLTKEVRLFPSEITGFVKEGNRSIGWYILLGLPFLVILAIVAETLFSSAVDLTQLWRKEGDVDMWVVFLTRLPFVLVALAIIETCGYVVGRLIYEIMRINRQRLEFSKLSIIAKDVTTASSLELEMSEEEVFEQEVKLKMELLREHMKNYSGSEFEYRGSALISAIVGVAERFTKKSGVVASE